VDSGPKTLYLCGAPQSSGSSLISWCFLQRGDTDGVLDARNDLLPQMPGLVFGDTVRAAHLTTGEDVPGVYTLRVMSGSDDILAAIESYEFDALSIGLPLTDPRLPRILTAAPISFIAVTGSDDRAALAEAGINWLLNVTHDGDDALSWELRPVNR
jgi:hypothetical protein